MTLHQDHYWLPWNQTQWKMCYCRDLWKQQGSPTQSPTKVPFLGDRATVQRASDHSGGAAHMQEARSKIEMLLSRILGRNLRQNQKQFTAKSNAISKIWSIPSFQNGPFRIPKSHLSDRLCPNIQVGWFFCRTFLCRTSHGGFPSFADMVATIMSTNGYGSLDPPIS